MRAALAAASPDAVWPAADVSILRSRPIRRGTDIRRLSRFGAETWWLAPAHPDAHHVVNSIRWRRFPPRFVLAFKTFALAALDHPFPLELAVGRTDELPNVATVQIWVADLRVFAEWMCDRGVDGLARVTDADLVAYRSHVLAGSRTADRNASLFNAVRALWAYRSHLPDGCRLATASPWQGASGHQLAHAAQPGRVNRTPRIAAATMEPLLAWALRVVEDIGPDIRDAWVEYRRLDDGTHPTHEKYHGLLMRDRIELFVEQATREGAALPGHRVDGRLEINWNQLGRILGRWSSWPPALRRRIHAAGLPIAEGSPIGCVNGRVDGRPWRDGPIRAQEFPLLIRVLVAACFITTCYLSGMRPGEKRAELRLIQHSTTGTTG